MIASMSTPACAHLNHGLRDAQSVRAKTKVGTILNISYQFFMPAKQHLHVLKLFLYSSFLWSMGHNLASMHAHSVEIRRNQKFGNRTQSNTCFLCGVKNTKVFYQSNLILEKLVIDFQQQFYLCKN